MIRYLLILSLSMLIFSFMNGCDVKESPVVTQETEGDIILSVEDGEVVLREQSGEVLDLVPCSSDGEDKDRPQCTLFKEPIRVQSLKTITYTIHRSLNPDNCCYTFFYSDGPSMEYCTHLFKDLTRCPEF